jgi:hypothetical protein
MAGSGQKQNSERNGMKYEKSNCQCKAHRFWSNATIKTQQFIIRLKGRRAVQCLGVFMLTHTFSWAVKSIQARFVQKHHTPSKLATTQAQPTTKLLEWNGIKALRPLARWSPMRCSTTS